MTFKPDNSYAPFLSTTTVLPPDENQALIVKLTTLFNDIALKTNNRDIASYELVETLTGQNWFSSQSQVKRQTFRRVYEITALTGGGTVSVAHGLGTITGFTFTQIYGTAKNAAGTLFVPLPQGGPDDVMITIDATNINVICATATYNNFSALVVLEYLKN